MTDLKCGEKADVTIKGVRVVNHPSARLVRIADEHGDAYDMPPQAAITRPGEPALTDTRDRIDAALAFLDNLEAETILQPYVAAQVRETLGLPPRHWPPQPGDVWDDGYPFGGSLWFAREYTPESPDEEWPARIVMTCVSGGTGIKSPQDFLDYAVELKLIFRKDRPR